MRKGTRPSPAFPYWKQQNAGRGLGIKLLVHYVTAAYTNWFDSFVVWCELCRSLQEKQVFLYLAI